MPDATLVRVLDALRPPGLPAHMAVFAIVDGARDERIYAAVKGTFLPKACLYSGDLPWQLQMTAPYLVQLDREDRFTRYLIDAGWSRNWATFLRTETGIKQLRRHLREFLRVRDESGKRLIFRYYDPRVLRVYLPTRCSSACGNHWRPRGRLIRGRLRCGLRRGPPELGIDRYNLGRRIAQFRQEAADDHLRSDNRFRGEFLIVGVGRSEHFL